MDDILVGKGANDVFLSLAMANRHGLIAGATGTGKTITLKVLAEGFSKAGVPVFLADIKGDLAGICKRGTGSAKLEEHCKRASLDLPSFNEFPVTFWDVFGEQGHPIRATVSDLGPLLLSRLLNLNEVQSAVLSLVFKVADDRGMLLLDVKDLRAMLQYVSESSRELQSEYGNISAASVGSIQRGLLALEEEGIASFFGEPALNIEDLLQTAADGFALVNILAADKLIQSPKTYATFLLWLLSELYERLPEVGDCEKPKIVFFFDEAHLMFEDAPKVLLEKVEQVVRLIRSKGVGIFFVTQNSLDIPEVIAGQLGNRVQHSLRAFTAKDQKAVRAVAENFRSDGSFSVESAITELGVGEALVSMLDKDGTPAYVTRVFIAPPASQFGTVTNEERRQIMNNSLVSGQYEKVEDRESAYELLKKRANSAMNQSVGNSTSSSTPSGGGATPGVLGSVLGGILGGISGASSRRQNPLEAMVTSAARSVGSQLARQLVRGLLGTFGGRRV